MNVPESDFDLAGSGARESGTAFDVDRIRQDFPLLSRDVNEKPLVYLDNGATNQKPKSVINRMTRWYGMENANVHRGVHRLSQDGTDVYEQARAAVARFINAESPSEIVFTSGTTAAINTVAYSLGQAFGEGDEVLISGMEHHANIVPWQLVGKRVGFKIRVVPVTASGELDMDAYREMIGPKTRLVAMAHVSNTLGTVNPVHEITEIAHQHSVPVLLDGAQAAPHMSIDLAQINCDFYAFSAHKMCGPMGMGVLFGRLALLERMPPFMGGGDMIDEVSFEETTFDEPPQKFEAGTPHVPGVLGLHAAIDYMERIGIENIHSYEQDLLEYATEALLGINGLKIYGTAPDKAAVISFLVKDIHPYDAGTILDSLGIATRTGHHCTQPLMRHFEIPGTVRASFSFYNTREEVDLLVDGIRQVVKMFS